MYKSGPARFFLMIFCGFSCMCTYAGNGLVTMNTGKPDSAAGELRQLAESVAVQGKKARTGRGRNGHLSYFSVSGDTPLPQETFMPGGKGGQSGRSPADIAS